AWPWPGWWPTAPCISATAPPSPRPSRALSRWPTTAGSASHRKPHERRRPRVALEMAHATATLAVMTDAVPPFIIAIPARHASTRLPGKPLRLLGDRPLVVHVAQRAMAAGAEQVVVATDDARIASALEGAGEGIDVCMTRADHASGS